MKTTLMQSLLVLSLTGFAALPSRAATITITFDNNGLFSVIPGQGDIAAFATLTNTDAVNPVFLNGDDLNIPGAASVTDEFFTNVPISLDPGETTAPIELFRFNVAAGATPGTITGSYQLLGGIGDAAQFNLDAVGSQTFTVTVLGTPEPSTEMLVGGTFIGLAILGRRLRRRKT